MMLKSASVLVIDDEKSLRDFVRINLEVRGYNVTVAPNGADGLAVFQSQHIDLVILDIMMPNMDGLETTRRIRQISIVPIIILTALGEESDKVKAFDLGADDYLTKPFGIGELLSRVKAGGKELDLTPTEFNLLVYLMRNAGKTLSHRAILQNVWGPEYGDEAEYLRVYMGKLRQKVEKEPLKPRYILTERGIGYRFEC
jgi:two-component system, OmpR family, KDP operon response regulator KdpE